MKSLHLSLLLTNSSHETCVALSSALRFRGGVKTIRDVLLPLSLGNDLREEECLGFFGKRVEKKRSNLSPIKTL